MVGDCTSLTLLLSSTDVNIIYSRKYEINDLKTKILVVGKQLIDGTKGKL